MFMRLADWDLREHVLRIPYSEVASRGYIWVFHCECHNAPQVNRYAPGTMFMCACACVCVCARTRVCVRLWINAWNQGAVPSGHRCTL